MGRRSRVVVASLIAGLATLHGRDAAAQVTVGQVDTFENGTTLDWTINLLNMGTPPAGVLPTNIPTGGPGGVNDNFLRLASTGVAGAGGRLVAINFMSQWAGNYLAAGVGAIRLDAINLGNTDLQLRMLFENPLTGPPTDLAASGTAQLLRAGAGWTSLVFPLFGAGGLVPIAGNLTTLLSNTTAIRLYHAPTLAETGPFVGASIGVDNITATAVVPEPTSVVLVGTGALALLALRRRGRA